MLDRDEGTGGREVWDLSVLAWEDGGKGLASSVPFRLTLKDINDNAPYLIQSNTSLPVIMENKDPEGVTIPVEADDFDDHVTNGPPYRFLLDPSADSDILKKFSVKTVGVSGEDQRAEICPLVKLDREEHKQYIIPVIVSDSKKAEPRSMTGTSLFTVIVGDENDNPMKPGSSTIQVFNLEGTMPDTVVGRVFVEDPDDWDLPDKTFSWLTGQDRDHFQLDTDTGYITMKYGTPNGTYPLRFQVHDKKFDSEVDADVTVVVRLLPREAVIQSGSVRIRGVSAEGFVSSPDKNTPSLYERMIPELASLLGTSPENVDLFGVQDSGTGGVDVRYAAHGSPYYDTERLNGLVGMNQKRIEEVLKIEIEQVGIDDCIYETTCRGSCFSGLEIYDKEVYKVQTNRSSIVAVRTAMRYTCGECHQPVTPVVCLNGGHLMNSKPPRCECPDGYAGPNCESLIIHFKGDGYAWFPHLTACNASHMSFDLTTSASQGLVMYNGPLAEPAGGVQDFFAVDVVKGRLRVFLNYGTGTAVASPESRVDDGRLHHVEVNWNTEGVAVLIDSCVGNGPCQALTPALSSGGAQNAFLNVATPLQLGGSAVPLDNIRALMTWMVTPTSAGFTGCLQNVTFLDKVYNLGQPAYGEEYSSYCEENHQPMPVIYANSGFLAALLCCVIIVLGLLVAVLLYRRMRQRKHYTGSNHELRQSIVQSTEEGDPEKDAKYDLAALQVEQRKETAGPAGDAGLHRPTGSAATIDGRKSAANADDAVCPADDLRNYVYEGKGSSAGSLSTINSGSDDGDQSFEYLQELGPRFRRLADLYGDEADQSDSDSGRPFRTGHTVAESWC